MSHRILVSDLRRHTADLRAEIIAAATRVVDSGWFVHGQACSAFEDAFAQYCGVRHCLGVANGTDALEIALRSLGVTAQSKVATVANAGFYTTTALLAVGAEPIFIDVNPETRLMDLNHLAHAVSGGEVNAVVVTHLYGLMHDVEAICAITAEANIPVLEDCAQSHGAQRNGQRAGSIGHAATFSFYPTKNLGAVGDGGAIVTDDADVAARVRLLRQYGWDSKYHSIVSGARNSRLDEMQAAILSAKLPRLDAWNARRREIAARYSAEIKHPAISCPPIYGTEYVGHLYVIECADRDSLRKHLEKSGISSDIHYPFPDYRQPAIATMIQWQDLPITERLSQRVLTIPCYPELADTEIDLIIECINSW
jgi:dTDP-4-amino-4,6-dideoxygalactose transaminase